MIYSIRLGIQSQSITPDFRDSTGQIEKDNGILCAFFNQQILWLQILRVSYG
jgi:hypothetical protein